MWHDQPFHQPPTNFPEEERLLKRCYRLLASVQSVRHAVRKTKPRLGRDLEGLYWLLGKQVAGIEGQLHHVGRLRTWLDEDARRKDPPASETLLVRLFAVTRRAADDVRVIHDHVAETQEGKESCGCNICADVWDLSWLLGKVRRLFVAERKAVQA